MKNNFTEIQEQEISNTEKSVLQKPPAVAGIDFRVLDGLRGVAAIYVVINHCRGFIQVGGNELAKQIPVEKWSLFTKMYYASLQLTTLGREFVIFFFVLSGFSIAHSLTKNSAAIPFYKRRLIRLYPSYILALIYAAIVFGMVHAWTPWVLNPSERSVFASLIFIVKNLFYIPTGSLINQFWSLSHEVIFYIIIPFFFLKNLKAYFIISVLLYVSGWIHNWNGLTGSYILSRFLFDFNFFFAVGILVYKNQEKLHSIFSYSKEWILWVMSGSIIIISMLVKFKLGEDNRITSLLFCFLSVILLILFLQKRITNKILQFFGNQSYTIYITHIASIYVFILVMNVLGVMQGRTTDKWFLWILAVFFCIALASPFYLLAEKPTKKILSRLR